MGALNKLEVIAIETVYDFITFRAAGQQDQATNMVGTINVRII